MCKKLLPHGNFHVAYTTLYMWPEPHFQATSAKLCTICRRWSHFKADRRLFCHENKTWQ